MIIHRIHAENVLKYTSLKLDDLPERGLIAITGPNESGKSTIGETLCFALFGRTFSLDFDNLEKIIYWGQTHCSVELDFTASDGKKYTLERFLDDSGNHSARITLADPAMGDEPLARGVEKVADMVFELIGYEYEEFIESFYLAQREITTPHPHSYAIKTMAGLVTMEYCASAFKDEVSTTQAAMQETKNELSSLDVQIEEIELDPQTLPGLEAEHLELTAKLAGYDSQLEALDRASIDYQEALPIRENSMKKLGRNGFMRFLALLLALICAGAWGLLTQLPDNKFSGMLSEQLAGNIPNWHADMVPWILYGAVAFAVLFVLLWIRISSLEKALRLQVEKGKTLSSILDGLAPAALEADVDVGEEIVSEETSEAEPAPSSDVVDSAVRERLSQRVSGFQADFAEVREGVGKEQNLLKNSIDLVQQRLQKLDEALSEERSRVGRVEGLSSIRNDLKQKNAERLHQMGSATLAGELIMGAMREISHQFNHKVRSLVSKTLPLFTEGRYEHLQIDEDLTVRAFSSEKSDFMDLEEISSGTQRQIMLAVRLALSQELVGRTVKANQFLFLDEPFAFFDQARTRSSLTVLPTLSEQLNQIWIIGQEFPDDLAFDRHIKCDREYKTIPALEA